MPEVAYHAKLYTVYLRFTIWPFALTPFTSAEEGVKNWHSGFFLFRSGNVFQYPESSAFSGKILVPVRGQ